MIDSKIKFKNKLIIDKQKETFFFEMCSFFVYLSRNERVVMFSDGERVVVVVVVCSA